MNQQEIYLRLLDLPTTFKRNDLSFAQWIDAVASALYLFCQASDNLQGVQTNFQQSSNGWLDIWGELCGIGRRDDESNEIYQYRIIETLMADRDSAVAIVEWIQAIENLAVQVTENIPTPNQVGGPVYGVGYNIIFPPTQSLKNILRILTNLVYVRPAGVPFNVYFSQGGDFLNTINYFGNGPQLNPAIGRVTGAYLASNPQPLQFSLGASTNNTTSLLPNLFFTDPTLNPPLRQ